MTEGCFTAERVYHALGVTEDAEKAQRFLLHLSPYSSLLERAVSEFAKLKAWQSWLSDFFSLCPWRPPR
ncbi:MAG: hypothetical protein EA362_10705 [Saprospirales bacterium]|nr:MAG: hypothetical protein EA362_10705 [Saprospirales bacterium]